MVTIRRVDTVDRFVATAGAFLVAREAEHNLLLGICSGLQALAAGGTPTDDPAPDFLVASSDDRIVLAASGPRRTTSFSRRSMRRTPSRLWPTS